MTEPESTPNFADLEHDVRNVAAAIQSAVDVIRSDSKLSSDSKDMIAILDRQLGLLVKRVGVFCSQRVLSDLELNHKDSDIQQHEDNPSELRSLDVLIVDDTRLVTHALQRLLETMGQCVRTAPSGAAAMEALLERMPNLVFSDIGMTGMDGYELAKQIRAVPHGCDAYLVALTGHSSFESKRHAIDAGFDEYHEKPITSTTLLTILRKFCHAHGMAENVPIRLVDLRSLNEHSSA
jgi:CheY-like chemotaxis protein